MIFANASGGTKCWCCGILYNSTMFLCRLPISEAAMNKKHSQKTMLRSLTDTRTAIMNGHVAYHSIPLGREAKQFFPLRIYEANAWSLMHITAS